MVGGATLERPVSAPTLRKRQKEKDREENQRAKLAERARRRRERALRSPPEPGVDPDISDIVPGPQRQPEGE